MSRKAAMVMCAAIGLLVGVVAGRISANLGPVGGSWPVDSDSMPQPVKKPSLSSVESRAMGSSCVFTDEFGVFVFDRFGALPQDQLDLVTLRAEKALLEQSREKVKAEWKEVGRRRGREQ